MKTYLSEFGHEVIDKGAFKLNPDDDYPDFVRPVAEEVAKDTGSRGIILGGSGQGEAMCANRIKGVRAALFYGQAVPKRFLDFYIAPLEMCLSIHLFFKNGNDWVERK